MKVHRAVLILAIWLTVIRRGNVSAQGLFQRGDLLVSGYQPTGLTSYVSKILVYGSDGVYKRELTSINNSLFFETLVDQNGIVFATVNFTIQRMDSAGSVLSTFATFVRAQEHPHYLAPGLNGRIFTAAAPGSVYGFEADGLRFYTYDIATALYGPAAGIDLAPDQCTLFVAINGYLTHFDVCQGRYLGALGPALPYFGTFALRLLADGSFLISYHNGIAHLDSAGNPIKLYPFPGDVLGLDVDGTSFWTAVSGSLFKIDIATGQVLLGPIFTGYGIFGVGVVGEPRAGVGPAASSIPALSRTWMVILALTLAAVAILRLRY